MGDERTILILGGGVGGTVTALELRRRTPGSHRVVLIEREQTPVFEPSLLWLAIGLRTAEKISRRISRLRRNGVEVVHGEIERIEPLERRVVVDGDTLAGDYLVVALGAELAPEATPGLSEAGHNLYTARGASSLDEARVQFAQGRLVVLTAAPAYKCPAAPYEAAMLLESDCRKRRVRDRVQIDFYAAEPAPMGVAGPEISAAVRQMIEQKGIEYHPDHQVAKVDPRARCISFTNGATVDFDLLAYVPAHRAPRVVREASLIDDSGWVPVDRHNLATHLPGVFAVGDVTSIPLSLGKPLPKAGVFARGQAETVARNIAAEITGRGKPATFDGHGECFLETGNGRAGFGRGNFYAEPTPEVKLHKPGRLWHLGKVLYERRWLRR